MSRTSAIQRICHKFFQQKSFILTGSILLSMLTACGGGSDSGPSAITNMETATTNENMDANVTAPTGLNAKLNRISNNILLTWTPLTNTATRYRVYWSQGRLPNVNAIFEEVDTATYTHSELLDGSTYTFQISSLLNGVESNLSPTVTVVNKASLPPSNGGSDTGL